MEYILKYMKRRNKEKQKYFLGSPITINNKDDRIVQLTFCESLSASKIIQKQCNHAVLA